MSLINEEYLSSITTLEKVKEEMRETIVELSKECEDIFFRLENYEAIKEK